MDLIDRAAAIDALRNMPISVDGCASVSAAIIAMANMDRINKVIAEQPTIPAVPLGPLCEWLAEHYGSPCQLAEIECYPQCEPDENGECYGMRTDDKRCWHDYLTKWMEGQNDTE